METAVYTGAYPADAESADPYEHDPRCSSLCDPADGRRGLITVRPAESREDIVRSVAPGTIPADCTRSLAPRALSPTTVPSRCSGYDAYDSRGEEEFLECLHSLLESIDAACSRLATKRHTRSDVLSTSCITSIPLTLKGYLNAEGVEVLGGVFDADRDPDMWPLSNGYDVEFHVLPDCNRVEALSLVRQAVRDLQSLVRSFDHRFAVRQASWLPEGQFTVVTLVDVAKGELIGEYDGYFIDMNDLSNPHYNGNVGGTGGSLTVDPTCGDVCGDGQICVEFAHCIPCRLNEPPPGKEPNCMWKINKNEAPEMLAGRDIEKGEELFIFYGAGFEEERTYPIAEGLSWWEAHDSYNSDVEQ